MYMSQLQEIGKYRYRLPKNYRAGMKVDGKIYANQTLLEAITRDQTLDQVANVAMLPGLVSESIAMPDAHQGYGFCIGGVAAVDPEEGVVSAGGVGFDINCGVRLLASPFEVDDIKPHVDRLLDELFKAIPCGTGREGSRKLSEKEIEDVLENGARWAVKNRYGEEMDLNRIEESGTIKNADSSKVSNRAKQRGIKQLGTLGSGNHFLELQIVDAIFDDEAAAVFGLSTGQIVILIHTGSRGLGHQVCTDYLDLMQHGLKKYKIDLPDRQLACVPVRSEEGDGYLKAMAASANFAFANRQMITHWTRDVFERVMKNGKLRLVYDVAHNIAKFEKYPGIGTSKGERAVLVHRKGATRAFPKGHPDVPDEYRSVGQPVLIPGSMGTSSYVLVGSENAMLESYGSTCHGAGRAMSRKKASQEISAIELLKRLNQKGIKVRGASKRGLTEEQPDAYKDVESVVDVVHEAGLSKKVARLVPIGVIKG
jgi:tRNA-splicing ligase RtcB (3'-phosphate/5'-hydroxy nucleic acid ligase)